MKTYGSFRDFEIRDLGTPPAAVNSLRFDIVKWQNNHEYCYSIGTLEWNPKEPCFEFRSCGLRYLEVADTDLNQWIRLWCDMMEYKLLHEEDEDD